MCAHAALQTGTPVDTLTPVQAEGAGVAAAVAVCVCQVHERKFTGGGAY